MDRKDRHQDHLDLSALISVHDLPDAGRPAGETPSSSTVKVPTLRKPETLNEPPPFPTHLTSGPGTGSIGLTTRFTSAHSATPPLDQALFGAAPFNEIPVGNLTNSTSPANPTPPGSGFDPDDFRVFSPAADSTPQLPQALSLGPTPPGNGVMIPALSPLPIFISLKTRIVHDLELNMQRLLTLEPSRREALATYLDRLSGQTAGPSSIGGNVDAAGGLSRWITGPRNPAQNAALQAYFEEVALITLGHALLLKAWADRGIRPTTEKDLSNLNWALNTALKPVVPIDRESWMVARQNIYSWYKLGPLIQRELWEAMQSWQLGAEGPAFLLTLFGAARQARTENTDPSGYDPRFYEAIWSRLPAFGIDLATPPAGPIRRPWMVFSPTLRDGSCVRSAPSHVTWIGLENSPFSLMVAELTQLWCRPAAPPLWSVGYGLEVHSREQLTLSLGSPKPSLLTRITEMEACDVALVQEERTVRTQGRSPEALRFRERLETLPYFKKLKGPMTSLGDLQACVALSKLRPGGLLFWAREEPLTEHDGKEALNFLLERGKLLCEWDFSELQHQLPVRLPLFPRHLYLFVRESRVEERLTWRPIRISLHGQIRSHIELPVMFREALGEIVQAALRDPEHLSHALSAGAVRDRSQWRIQAHRSPVPQRDWMERWPDPASQTTIRNLDRLRDSSLTLASVTTIRHTPAGDPARNNAWSVHPGLKGLWIQGEADSQHGGRRLVARPLKAGTSFTGSGFLVLVPDLRWIAPLCQYLESETLKTWLDHHAERKGDRWIMSEALVRWIPVPQMLLASLGHGPSQNPNFGEALLAANKAAREILAQPPEEGRARLSRLSQDAASAQVRAALYVQAALEQDQLAQGIKAMHLLVKKDGRIRWGELLRMLPASENVGVSLHPRVRTAGNLPVQIAIGRIEPIKTPQEGILFATEAGFSLKLVSDSPILIEMIWDQLEGLSSPTWSELVSHLKLPRRLELAESTAIDVLKLYGDRQRRSSELQDLLDACPLY